MAALAASPHLRRLVHLHVGDCPVGDAGVAAFVSSPNAGRLRILEVPGVGDDALMAIGRSPHLDRLTIVSFGGWVGSARFAPTTDAGALAVARSANLPNLVVLNRHWPREAVAGLRALIQCDRLAYAGWTTYDVDPDLTPDRQRAAALPHRFTATGALFSLSPWMADARL